MADLAAGPGDQYDWFTHPNMDVLIARLGDFAIL
jgi:hypothetical protein